MVQRHLFNHFLARTAGMLSGARRASLMLLATLLLTLTAQTAWAQGVDYIDATGALKNTATDGIDGNDSPTELTGSESGTLPAGWYVVKSTFTYDHTLSFGGDVHIILADGYEMNFGTSGSRVNDKCITNAGPVTIYGQTAGSGTINIYPSKERPGIESYDYVQNGGVVNISATEGIRSNSFTMNGGTLNISTIASYRVWGLYISGNVTMNDGVLSITASGGEQENNGICSSSGNGTVNILGGKLTASASGTTNSGIFAKTVYLGYKNADDFITVTNYNANGTNYGSDNYIVTGKKMTDGSSVYPQYDSGYCSSSSINGKTLRPYEYAFIVIFDKNASDATGTMNNQTIYYNTPQNLTTNAFERPDHVFAGWNTKDDGTGTPYTNEQEVNNLAKFGTVTLYAQWTDTRWGLMDDADGSQANPYLIRTRSNLNLLAERVNNSTDDLPYQGVYFKMTADLDYSSVAKTLDGGKSNFTCIGTYGHSFCGFFDGDGHTISGIIIENSNNYQGLFGSVEFSGTPSEVKNIKLSNYCITDGNYNVGGIVGYLLGNINNCSVDGTVSVSGGQNIGGIVGNATNSSKVEYCVSAASVSGSNQNVGGIAGKIDGTTVRNNLYTGTSVTGSYKGAIIDYYSGSGSTLANNYYYKSGAYSQGFYNGDITTNDGAVSATILSDDVAALPSSLSGTVVFRREFKGGVPSTICLPFAQTVGSEGKYYGFTGVEEVSGKWTAKMETYAPINYTLDANTPYLFKAAGSKAHKPVLFHHTYSSTTYITAGTTPKTDWSFVGTYARKDWTTSDGNDYGFTATSGTATDGVSQVEAGDFVHFEAGAWLRPMRCYLSFTGTTKPWATTSAPGMNRTAASEMPKRISVVLIDADGSTTEIGTLDARTGEMTFGDEWYRLDGTKLSSEPTTKGMYIHKGKTVVIK